MQGQNCSHEKGVGMTISYALLHRTPNLNLPQYETAWRMNGAQTTQVDTADINDQAGECIVNFQIF